MKKRLTLLVFCAVLLLFSGCAQQSSQETTVDAIPNTATATTAAADLGIRLDTKDVTSSSLTLVITQSGGSFTGPILRGSDYSLEFWDAGAWKPLCQRPQRGFDLVAHDVPIHAVSQQQITFSLYGDLPCGNYRLSKTFVSKNAKGNTVEQVCTAEFRVESSNDPWGIELSAMYGERMNTGLMLVCTRNCGASADVIGTGEKYWIEKWDGQQWSPLKPVHTPSFQGIGWAVPANYNTGWVVNWEQVYGALPVGTYRIGKEFTRHISRDAYDDLLFETPSIFETRVYYAEFEIFR